jgi:hypothetical protein
MAPRHRARSQYAPQSSSTCAGCDDFGIANAERIASQERERDLARCGTELVRDRLECRRLRKPSAAPERAISDDGDSVRCAPRRDALLDRALVQVIEDLVACELAGSDDRERLVEIIIVEI